MHDAQALSHNGGLPPIDLFGDFGRVGERGSKYWLRDVLIEKKTNVDVDQLLIC